MIEDAYDLSSATKRILPEILELLATVDRPATAPEYPNVRLKIVRPKKPVILVNLSGVVTGLGQPHGLSRETLEKLRRLIFSALPDDYPRDRKDDRAGINRVGLASRRSPSHRPSVARIAVRKG